MSERYIAVLDSGIGGISVLNDLIEIMPAERFLYLGDNKNAPYGNKSIKELHALVLKNIDLIKKYPVKCLVVGCNTLSVTLLDEIKRRSNLPTFGVTPPIRESIALGGRSLLLATVRTSEKFKGVKNLTSVGLKGLVKDIEYNMFNARAIDLDRAFRETDDVFNNRKGYYDTVILGCTHYNFIKKQIFDYFCPQRIISGNEFTVREVKKYLERTNLLVKHKQLKVLFIGDCAEQNKKFRVKSGQKL